MKIQSSPGSVLTLDFECLPGGWIGSDYTSRVVTALAWAFDDEDPKVLTHYLTTRKQMAEKFGEIVRQAGVVTGHWCSGFDAPLGNGARLRENLPPVDSFLISDTKTHLLRTSGRSLSQQNLAASLGLNVPKVDMTLRDWESFNLREPGFRSVGEARVVGDVLQHRELRKALMELGWLGAPQVWNPSVRVSGYGRYHP
jgi:hypothetical protein